MRIGIDATNLGGGGGVTHLAEILANFNPGTINSTAFKVFVFSSKKVLDQLPDNVWINKIKFPWLNRGLLFRVMFQLLLFDRIIKKNCDILLSVSGDYTGHFKPVISISQNMLLYEREIWREIRQPKEVAKFWLNYRRQRRAFKNSDGIIFISDYAENLISRRINLQGKEIRVINHGVSPMFRGNVRKQKDITEYSKEKPFRFLYVSTVHTYKHQWNVIRAIGEIRSKGYPVELDLVGGVIFKPAGQELIKAIKETDPEGKFIHYHGHIPYNEINNYYKNADGIIFASTCENMPNILIESMASGVPVACSDKQPMPEFLKENGYYFNAHEVISIRETLEDLLSQPEQRGIMAANNLKEVTKYNWEVTSVKTFNFIEQIYYSKNNV